MKPQRESKTSTTQAKAAAGGHNAGKPPTGEPAGSHPFGGYHRPAEPDNSMASVSGSTANLTSVAIVEDNHDFRATLARYVDEAPGYRCVCACDTSEEALQKIPRLLPEVVLMDIHLPNMSGMDCTRRLKELCPGVQILILTVYEDNERIFGALKAGASGYLLKRADPADILAAIQDVKQGGAPMSSQIARRVVQSFRQPVAQAPKLEELSQREEEILQYLSKGYASKEIADRLSVSVNTVRTHLQHIYEKLHVRSRTEAVLKFLH